MAQSMRLFRLLLTATLHAVLLDHQASHHLRSSNMCPTAIRHASSLCVLSIVQDVKQNCVHTG